MFNTLLAFANCVRTGKLIAQVQSADDIDDLKELIDSA
jgi:hypothetical protein